MSIWKNTTTIASHSYTCGYCFNKVGPNEAFYASTGTSFIYICPNCAKPTFFGPFNEQVPTPPLGRPVSGISDTNLASLYREAMDCSAVNAYTAAVLACRKILMHVAVEKNAALNLSFAAYVDFLVDNGWVPPGSKAWVDTIRQKGNEANHEILLADKPAATQVVHFTEMLLRFIYELPSMVQSDTNPS